MSTRGEKAQQLFLQGYNCAQSIAVCFCDVLNLSPQLAAQISGGYGGGIGRMREVCGSFCGLTMVLSVALGYADPADREGKKRLYALTQKAGDAFRAKNGFLRCRDLLGIDAKEPLDPTPSERTADYYRRRPCDEIVKSAAEILEQILIDENILK